MERELFEGVCVCLGEREMVRVAFGENKIIRMKLQIAVLQILLVDADKCSMTYELLEFCLQFWLVLLSPFSIFWA